VASLVDPLEVLVLLLLVLGELVVLDSLGALEDAHPASVKSMANTRRSASKELLCLIFIHLPIIFWVFYRNFMFDYPLILS
jgi:hypothetical protein